MEGPDRCVWFCESGASKIGRFDPADGTFREWTLPTPDAMPIGLVLGGDGALWFAEKAVNQIGRITVDGEVTEFTLPTLRAGPDAMALGPDGAVWFSETDAGQIGRIDRGWPRDGVPRGHNAG